MLRRFK